jgi:hypothetical protein
VEIARVRSQSIREKLKSAQLGIGHSFSARPPPTGNPRGRAVRSAITRSAMEDRQRLSDYVIIGTEPHFLTDRCRCMPGVLVPDDCRYRCDGPKLARHWHWLQGYCSLSGRFRDGVRPETESGRTFCRSLWQERDGEIVKPCQRHAKLLAGLRASEHVHRGHRERVDGVDYPVTIQVERRNTLAAEVRVLNESIKYGLKHHVCRPDYKAIPHRHDWEETDSDAEGEDEPERQVRELQETIAHLRSDMAELQRRAPTREIGTQTD